MFGLYRGEERKQAGVSGFKRRVKWQTKLTEVYRDLNKGTRKKKNKTAQRASNNTQQRKLRAGYTQKSLLFLFIVNMLLDCTVCPVNKPFTIVVGVNEAQTFPIHGRAFLITRE